MKTIYGLFPSYRDAQGALEEFLRRGFDQADLSAVLRATALEAKPGPPLPGRSERGGPRGPRRGKRGTLPHPGETPAAPASQGNRPQPAGEPPPRPTLPGGRHIKAPGDPTLLASGRLAAAFHQGTAGEPTSQPLNLKGVLAGAGLPPAFVENYARGVSSGQTLLAVRTPDDRERDTVMIMRRHRVASLGGLPE